jgi:hypothetical protein
MIALKDIKESMITRKGKKNLDIDMDMLREKQGNKLCDSII